MNREYLVILKNCDEFIQTVNSVFQGQRDYRRASHYVYKKVCDSFADVFQNKQNE